MDDEDDADAPSSPPSFISTQHPRPNTSYTSFASPVTVAAAPRLTLTLAFPIQRAGAAAGGGSAGREDCWSYGATSALIDAWGERYLDLSRGNLRQKHWQEVADVVNAHDDSAKPPWTDAECKNRIDTLKKKYKLEKARAGPSKWAFLQRLDALIGHNHHHSSSAHHRPPAPLPLPPKASAGSSAADRKIPSFKIPVATPVVGIRSTLNFQKKNSAQLPSLRSGTISSKTAVAAVAAPPSPRLSEGFPPETANGRKRKPARGPPQQVVPVRGTQDGEEGLRELTKAVLKFGEVYERVEGSKLQQVVEMEKQRMGFAKEVELQRMQFFVTTQMELTHHLRRHGRISAAALANNRNSDDDTSWV